MTSAREPAAGAAAALGQAVEWTCQTLWLTQRREPELVELQARRGSTGYAHYIVSRAGLLPDAEWTGALYVLPPALVDHLRERCRALEPDRYLGQTLEAGAGALRRLRPQAPDPILGQLSRRVGGGPLPQAWAALPPSGDPHRDWLQAAMALREGRALSHYRAASARGLAPLELLELTALQPGADAELPQRLFRWSDQEVADARASLRRRGWLGPEPSPTESGRQASAGIEAETELWSATLLGDLGEAGLAAVAAAAAEFWPGSDS